MSRNAISESGRIVGEFVDEIEAPANVKIGRADAQRTGRIIEYIDSGNDTEPDRPIGDEKHD
jgi:hypothetical protein